MNAKELLNFDFDFNAFNRSADYTIDKSLIEKRDKLIDEIKNMNTKLSHDANLDVKKLADILLKFKRAYKEDCLLEVFDNNLIIRKLSHCLSLKLEGHQMILSSYDETKKVLDIFENNWNPSFLSGLFKTLVLSWGKVEVDVLTLFQNFISKKANAYNGDRKHLLSIKNNYKFFTDENGPVLLGLELVYKNVSLDRITEYLGLPKSYFISDFFCLAIVVYIEKSVCDQSELFRHVEEFLKINNSHDTAKRLISKLIVRLDINPDYEVINQFKDYVFQIIGDPEVDSNWYAPTSFTEAERSELTNARNILNKWIIAQFIDVFFRTCIDDEQRRVFWLKQVQYVNKFKIYGPQRFYNELKQDSRLLSFLKSKYSIISQGYTTAAAIVMTMNNHIIIEFSQENNALYVYRKGSDYCPSFEHIHSIKDLKQTYLNVIPVNENWNDWEFYQEGRYYHRENWEIGFENYLRRVVYPKI